MKLIFASTAPLLVQHSSRPSRQTLNFQCRSMRLKHLYLWTLSLYFVRSPFLCTTWFERPWVHAQDLLLTKVSCWVLCRCRGGCWKRRLVKTSGTWEGIFEPQTPPPEFLASKMSQNKKRVPHAQGCRWICSCFSLKHFVIHSIDFPGRAWKSQGTKLCMFYHLALSLQVIKTGPYCSFFTTSQPVYHTSTMWILNLHVCWSR
jgi:hypothetical protein